jgi:hypothetical protein
MDWIIVAKCSECKKQETFEVTSDYPPYSIENTLSPAHAVEIYCRRDIGSKLINI